MRRPCSLFTMVISIVCVALWEDHDLRFENLIKRHEYKKFYQIQSIGVSVTGNNSKSNPPTESRYILLISSYELFDAIIYLLRSLILFD